MPSARPCWRSAAACGSRVATVRHYAKAEAFPEHAAQRPTPSLLDPFRCWIETQPAASGGHAWALWRDLRCRGFRGAYRPYFAGRNRGGKARRSMIATASTAQDRPSRHQVAFPRYPGQQTGAFRARPDRT